MNRLTALAVGRSSRVLTVAGIVFLLAAVLGGPVAGVLKGRSTDFHDPNDQSLRTKAAIQRATGQSPDYGVAAVLKSTGDARTDPAAAPDDRTSGGLLAAQRGFQRVLDYPSSHLARLVSRDGHESVVLAAYATQEDSASGGCRLRPQMAGTGVRFGGQDVAFYEINTAPRRIWSAPSSWPSHSCCCSRCGSFAVWSPR